MPIQSPSSPTRRPHLTRQAHGAILLESLVALALVSLCAAGTFVAFDRLEGTSQAVHTLSADIRTQTSQSEIAASR